MLSNHPNVLGGGSTSSGGGETGVFTNVLVGDGNAGAPSYSFIADPDTGFYRTGSGTVAYSSNGVGAFSLLGGASGGVTFTALGSNQSITLTPSGTGAVNVSGISATGDTVGFSVLNTGSNGVSVYPLAAGVSNTSIISASQNLLLWANHGGSGLRFGVNGNSESAPAMTLSSAGDLLIGGLTTDGTGFLQLQAGTTAAGGITLGTDINLYRSQAGQLVLNAPSDPRFSFYENGTQIGTFEATSNVLYMSSNASGGSIQIRTGVTTTALTLDSSQNAQLAKKITSYNGVATAGWGVPAIQSAGRVTAQAAANASIATYTVGAADGSFRVSANMNVSASTALNTTLQCTYTDESNTARTMIFPIQQLTGSFIAGGLITGTGAWESPALHIRCKTATAITILTAGGTGTFTGVTYTAEGSIQQIA